ncbi:MAG: hypothetical protein RIA08_09840 [Roseovarius sp.]|uniref:hypothetical protein n=1 Tax=Roseovarius sp. TaxID=1486281 RepID=UPI0032EE7711
MKPENPADTVEWDLFGNPVEPLRDRRGRPSFAKSKENQDFVAVRAAAGWTHGMIATAIGCDEKTLRKHFSRELKEGALIVEGDCLDVLYRKVRQGHVPSVRQLREAIGGVAPAAPRNNSSLDAEEDGPEAPIGKKEQRLRDAQDVPADWGDIEDRRRTH